MRTPGPNLAAGGPSPPLDLRPRPYPPEPEGEDRAWEVGVPSSPRVHHVVVLDTHALGDLDTAHEVFEVDLLFVHGRGILTTRHQPVRFDIGKAVEAYAPTHAGRALIRRRGGARRNPGCVPFPPTHVRRAVGGPMGA